MIPLLRVATPSRLRDEDEAVEDKRGGSGLHGMGRGREFDRHGGRHPVGFASHLGIAGLLAACLAVATLSACASTWREHEDLVEPGMSRAEVLELLGEPSSRVLVPAWGDRPAHERWQWNDNLSTLATGAIFPDTVPDRVLAVGFDGEGKVFSVLLPRTQGP